MSIRILSRVLDDRTLTDRSHLCVLIALADWCNDEAYCWPAIDSIAQKSRFSRRSVIEITKQLQTAGRLKIIEAGGGNRSNTYQILFPEPPDGGQKEPKQDSGGVQPLHPSESAPVQESAPRGAETDTEGCKNEQGGVQQLLHPNRHRTVKEPSVHPRGGVGESTTQVPLFSETIKPPKASKEETDKNVQAQAVYDAYPRKVGRPSALKRILKAIEDYGYEPLLAKVTQFAALWADGKNGDITYCPHPETWFNQQRYRDNPETWKTRRYAENSPPGGTNGKHGPVVPLWRQQQALEEAISKHPANRDSAYYDSNRTEAQREEYRQLKDKLAGIKTQLIDA